MISKAIDDLKRGFGLYHVWLYQAYYELSAKYKRTVFGSLWIASNMVFTSLAISILWGALFNSSVAEHLPVKMSGNLVGITALFVLYDAPDLFMSSGGIIKNHAYPFTYFAFEMVARKIMLFFHNLVVFYIFMLVLGTAVVPNWTIIIGLPLLIVSMFFWGTLIGLMAARFRDLRFLLPNVGHLIFFLTPIYWDYSMLKPKDQWIGDLNPIYAMVSIVREPLLGKMPSEKVWIMALAVTALGAVFWLIFFSGFRRRIPFWV